MKKTTNERKAVEDLTDWLESTETGSIKAKVDHLIYKGVAVTKIGALELIKKAIEKEIKLTKAIAMVGDAKYQRWLESKLDETKDQLRKVGILVYIPGNDGDKGSWHRIPRA